MTEVDEFEFFINRIRAGDSAAAEEFVKRFEPIVRREIRMHMVDSRMTRVYDSTDFSQAVLATFFLRVSNGEYEINEPTDLVRLLISIARNKLASGARKLLSEKRDGHRRDVDSQVLSKVPDISDTPSNAVEMLELVTKAREQLSDEERTIVEMRGQGKAWVEIAESMGGTAQSRRMQLTRALDRVSATWM